MRAAAWAVLDANDKVIAVRLERDTATAYSGFEDGSRVAPLTLADLDDIDPD